MCFWLFPVLPEPLPALTKDYAMGMELWRLRGTKDLFGQAFCIPGLTLCS